MLSLAAVFMNPFMDAAVVFWGEHLPRTDGEL